MNQVTFYTPKELTRLLLEAKGSRSGEPKELMEELLCSALRSLGYGIAVTIYEEESRIAKEKCG